MSVITEKAADGLSPVIRVAGRFDFASHQAFQGAYRALPPGGPLVVDLADVSYMDSAALGMLLLLREHWASSADKIVLANVKGQPREVLQIANFGKIFRIE